MSYVSILLVH